ncbi:MAG: hypothetical protein HRU20_28935, partial [Pseudomonadales bacterium]|nr:hypothetical protein [Pseudomonadales bacterium]
MLRIVFIALVFLIAGCSQEADESKTPSPGGSSSGQTPSSVENSVDTAGQAGSMAEVSPQPAQVAVQPVVVSPQAQLVQQSAEFRLQWEDVEAGVPVVRGEGASVAIHGLLNSNSAAGIAALRAMFAVSDAGAVISVDEINPGYYKLIVKGVRRDKTCAKEVAVSWDGGDVDKQFSGSQNFIVPSVVGNDKSALQLVSSEIFPGDDGVLELVFNRTLKEGQALKHLISSDYRFTSYKIVANKVYLGLNNNRAKSVAIVLHKELQDECGIGLSHMQQKSFSIDPLKPGVRFTGKGVILPDAEKIELPFQAVSAKSVTITAFEVFENNIAQFLQENKLGETKSLERVGRFIWQKSITLDESSIRTWKDYRLDISALMQKKTGSLIRLYLSVDRGDSLYPCSDAENAVAVPKKTLPANAEQFKHEDGNSSWDMWQQGRGNYHSNNACKDDYYANASETQAAKNLLRSNIGLIVKQAPASDRLHVTVTSLKTAAPIEKAKVEVFNYQGQRIGAGWSDSRGFASFQVKGKPFYLKAFKDMQDGYIKLSAISALTTSQFDIGGKHLSSNINGFIYGEREVWRPS